MSRKLALLFGLALVVVALDQWTKLWVVQELTMRFTGPHTLGQKLEKLYGEAPPPGYDGLHFTQKRTIEVSPHYFRLRYAENPGAAWGLLRTVPENVRAPLFHVVILCAVVLITFYALRLGDTAAERWARWGLPLVLGGALGNYADRFARGFVIDYLEAHWRDRLSWPSFNVADIAISVGVGMLMLDAFVRREQGEAPASIQA